MSYSFGWVPSPDDERDYPFSLALEDSAKGVPRERMWPTGAVLDQGKTNSCVGQAFAGWMLCAPVRSKATSSTGLAIWREAAAFDGRPSGWTGGVTGRSGLKAMKARKKIAAYFATRDADEVRDYVLRRGPVVMCCLWWEHMAEPRGGLMTADGRGPLGGHASLLRGYSGGKFRLRSSWGTGWAQNGEAWLPLATLQTLLNIGGEAWAAKEAS